MKSHPSPPRRRDSSSDRTTAQRKVPGAGATAVVVGAERLCHSPRSARDRTVAKRLQPISAAHFRTENDNDGARFLRDARADACTSRLNVRGSMSAKTVSPPLVTASRGERT